MGRDKDPEKEEIMVEIHEDPSGNREEPRDDHHDVHQTPSDINTAENNEQKPVVVEKPKKSKKGKKKRMRHSSPDDEKDGRKNKDDGEDSDDKLPDAMAKIDWNQLPDVESWSDLNGCQEFILKSLRDLFKFDRPIGVQPKLLSILFSEGFCHRNLMVTTDDPKCGVTTSFMMAGLNMIEKKRRHPQMIVICKSDSDVLEMGSDMIEKMSYYESTSIDVCIAILDKKDRGVRNKITQQIVVGTPSKLLERIQFKDFISDKVMVLIFEEWNDMTDDDVQKIISINHKIKRSATRLLRMTEDRYLNVYQDKLKLKNTIFYPKDLVSDAQDIIINHDIETMTLDVNPLETSTDGHDGDVSNDVSNDGDPIEVINIFEKIVDEDIHTVTADTGSVDLIPKSDSEGWKKRIRSVKCTIL